MRLKQKMRTGASRIARAVLAGVLAIGLAPSVAFADLQAGDFTKDGATAMSTDGYVKAAAHAAANPAPELLGLNNPNQRSDQEGENTYNFFGDPEININPDPYLYNGHNGLTPGWVIGGRSFASPAGSLLDYNLEDEGAAQNQVWAQLPEIVLGTGSTTIPENESSYYTDFARNVETGLGLPADSYNPIGVTYNYTNLPTMIQTMYRLAAAANTAVENSGGALQTRYGDPMVIAQDYERYIVGQKGLVKQAIDTGKVQKRTIALVESYDTDAHAYTIITDGVAEGTATTNRALEPTQGVTNNYYASVEDPTRVTSDMLKDNVDVIIIGGQSSMPVADLVTYLDADGLVDKTFYCTNWASGTVFVTYANSVENAQNVGRILPCVYPEVLDQSDMLAYYFETFYHVKTGQIAQLMAERLDGVRNWANTDSAARTSWEESDYEGYSHDAVQAQLIAGVGYLNGQAATDPDLEVYVKPTENVSNDVVADTEITDSAITVSGIEESYAYTGEAIEPQVVVKSGETELVKGQDFLVSYSDNTNIGTATVTITGINKYSGTVTANFAITALGDISEASIKKLDDEYAYTGEAISIKPSVTLNDVKLTQGKDFEVVVQQDGADAEFKELGTYDVTIKGIGGYVGSVSKQIKVVSFFTVYLQKGTAAAEAVKAYKDSSEFSSLASGAGDPVSALFFKDGVWQVSTAVTYVTLEDLLADAGIADQWTAGATISYGKSNFTYEQIQAKNKFFPDAKQATSGTDTAAKDAPFVFSLTEFSGATDASNDAAAVEAANIAAANKANAPRTIFGVDDEEYASMTAAGQRLWSNVASITIKVPAVDVTDTVSVAPEKPSYTYTGKPIEAKLVVKVGDTVLTEGTDYAVSYSNNTNAGTANAVVTLTGTYTGTASATFAIDKADIALPKAKTGLVYNGKAQTGVAAGAGYTVKGNSATDAGDYTATLTADANHAFAGKATATVKWSIAKANGAITLKAKSKKAIGVKAGKSLKAVKAYKVTANTSKGKVTYKKTKGNKKITVAANGKITVKKGLKKGKTYTIKVKATSAATTNYNAATSKVVTVKIKVK